MSNPFLSIVIPAYNEEKRVEDTLYKIISYIDNKNITAEIVIADDGSNDSTEDVVKRVVAGKVPLKYLTSSINRGKGNAVKRGMLASEGEYSLLTDADLSTPMEELDKFLPFMNSDTSVTVGTRKTEGANVIKHQHFIRENMGKVFTLITNAILFMNQTDYTCGFKVFGAESRKRIFSVQRVDRWGYDAEILFLAKLYGYSIKDVPVLWENSEATRVNLIQDTVRTFKELFEIRVNQVLRKY